MRVLVVEDEHKIANSIKQGLEQEKYAVDAAYTGSDGFDLASTEDSDGSVSAQNIQLNPMSGVQLKP
ncbi:hypothetical protein KKE48_01125 [Patescibacteria group bacterium]|nr:hypothetical protein [Patescibacteria group bacterium]MBU1499453.1 hypothetical protein [Patescibacteria group bacterium]